MTLAEVRALIAVGDEDMVPSPGLFRHQSLLHGQGHVARVLVHALRLIEAVDCAEEAPRLWASVYLHDIARTHDGRCARHGADAWARLSDLPDVRALFERGGVRQDDFPAIEAAVTVHSNGEPDPAHPHWRLMALLKDADALDRVRLGDLKSKMLRHQEARGMIGFASELCDWSRGALRPGPDYFARLWPEALRLLDRLQPPGEGPLVPGGGPVR